MERSSNDERMEAIRLQCPACCTNLVREDHDVTITWRCTECDGSAVTMPVLRQYIPAESVATLRAQLRDTSVPSSRRCPACGDPMRMFDARREATTIELDACRICHLVWFDRSELARMGVVFRTARPSEIRRAIADLEVETLVASAKAEAFREAVRNQSSWLASIFDAIFQW